MKKFFLSILALSCGVIAIAQSPRSFVCADYSQNKVFIVEKGEIVWSHEAPMTNDVWLLDNGNVLFAAGNAVLEMNRMGDTLFHYKTKSTVFACQRLKNGNTFVAESSGSRLLDVAPNGEIEREIKLTAGNKSGDSYIRGARRLDNGNTLVCHYSEGMVREYNSEGDVVWKAAIPEGAHSVVRLKNGHTLVSGADMAKSTRLYEFDANGDKVWEFSNEDVEGEPFFFFGGMHPQKNGNIVITNWVGHSHIGESVLAAEITRDKRIVWSLSDHDKFRALSSIIITDKKLKKGYKH